MGDVDYSKFNALFRLKKSTGKWRSKNYKTNGTPCCFEVSPDGLSLAIGTVESEVNVIRLNENNEFEQTDRQQRHRSKITEIAFNPTANLIATCSNEATISITSYEAESSKIGSRSMNLKMKDTVRAVQFIEDLSSRSNLLISGVGRQVCITDCSYGTTFKNFSGHTGAVTGLCMWGGCMFASSSTDKTIRIWDMRVDEAVNVFGPLSNPAAVGSTTFQVDSSGRLLFRGDKLGVIHIIDITSNKKVTNKRVLNGPITYLRMSRSKRFLLAADQTSINLCDYSDVFKVPPPSLVTNIQSRVIAGRWHSNLPKFFTLDEQFGLRFWELQTDEPRAVNSMS